MKFKKWTISNKYGIPQMKMWSIEQPVKEDANSNFSTFDKEVSMYRFIAPNLINLSKDLCKNFKIAISIYVCSLTWYGLAYLSANNDKIFNEVFKPHAVDIIPVVIMALLFIEMFHLVKNIFTETRTVREMFYIFTLSVLLIYLNIFLKGKLMSLDLLNRIVMITILVETVSSMILFIYDVIRVVSAYKKGIYIVIYEENRTNHHIAKNKEVKKDGN
jgi:hypothetical protein